MEKASIILDILTAAVLLVAAIRGASRGFIKTITGFAVTLLSFVGAWLCARLFSSWLVPVLSPIIEKTAMPLIEKAASPERLNIAGINVAGLQVLADAAGEGIRSLANGIVQEITKIVAYAATALLSFILLQIVLRIILKTVDTVAKMPVLSLANRMLGLVVGLFSGALIMIILAWIIGFFDAYVTEESIQATALFKYFADIPMSLSLLRRIK